MSTPKPTAFVIMPFAPEFDDIYTRFLHPVLTATGFDVRRADDIMSQQNILRDVIGGIINCDLIVADLTGANPNVFYELGVAHALNKPVILITQSRNDVPFDLEQYRSLEYSRDFASIEDSKGKLTQYASQFLQGDVSFSNPVRDFHHIRSIQKEPSVAATANQPEENGQGYLDHIVIFFEGYEKLAESFLTMLPDAQGLESKLTAVTSRITELAANPNSSTSRTARDMFRRIAIDIGVFATRLHETNETYITVTQSTQPSLEFIASFEASQTRVAIPESYGPTVRFTGYSTPVYNIPHPVGCNDVRYGIITCHRTQFRS